MPDVTGSSGFDPIAAAGATVLLLGSLPSRQSLSRRQYYGNPHNVFWRVMGELLHTDPSASYADRVAWLVGKNIAVWDVLKYSVRPGSMDADIDEESAVANDFAAFLHKHRRIKLVCFNGQKAARLYARLVLPQLPGNFGNLEYATLPSTSPAFAAMNFAAKLDRWSIIRGVINVP
jgi:hypoxanthine-DNA glycosylase